jgi:hypothetical protein
VCHNASVFTDHSVLIQQLAINVELFVDTQRVLDQVCADLCALSKQSTELDDTKVLAIIVALRGIAPCPETDSRSASVLQRAIVLLAKVRDTVIEAHLQTVC